MKRRRFYYRRNSWIYKAVCIFIVLLISVLLLDAKLRPALYDLATLEAYAISSETVNSAVEKILSKDAPSYSEIVSIHYNESNAVTGITTDIVKLNLFKSQITKAIDNEFSQKGKAEIRISLGTAFGIDILSDFGPYIDVDVEFSSSTQSDFENIFTSAGINQTQHSVMLNIKTTVMLTMSGKRITQTVATSFCIAQTVIVGTVPDVMVEG